MARFSGAFVFIAFLVVFATFVSRTESRKLLLATPTTTDQESKNSMVSSFASLLLNALPKGRVPSSSPTKKGHATLDNEELFKRHLSRIDRILQSVPSPGVGH